MNTVELDAGYTLFATDALLTQLQALCAEVAGVRQATDIECIHRMRVASRRLRASLALFANALPEKPAAEWRTAIRRLTRALGAARDADVQIAFVQEFLATQTDRQTGRGVRRVLLRLQQTRAGLQPRVEKALARDADGPALHGMEETLRQLRIHARLQGAPATSPPLFQRALEMGTARLEAMLAFELYVEQPERKEELHAMRIAAKRLRYTLQTFAPLFPDELKPYVRAAKAVQEHLGEIHDCDVWEAYLATFLDAEREKALAYSGSAAVIPRLQPGITALRANRRQHRAAQYAAFLAFWQETQQQDLWGALLRTLREQAG